MRTEHEANLALQPIAKPSWQQPSICKRTTAKRSWLARLFNLFA